MAANADPNKSIMAPAAAATLPSKEELPVVEVSETSNGKVVVRWGEGGAKQTSAGWTSSYADTPFSFSAVDSNGDEPLIKTFGTLLGCDGGVLTIGGTRYRIQVTEKFNAFAAFKRPPPQQPSYLNRMSDERLEKIAAFAEAEMDDRTKNKRMSEASADWAESILAAYGVKHDRLKKAVAGAGSFKDPPPYEWSIQTNEGETWNEGDHGGTPGALEWLKENFMVSSGPYDLKVVTGAALPKVKGNRRSATGKTDILIGDAEDIHKGSTFDFAMGLVELKTSKYPLKVGQNLLELLSLSTASTFNKAVVLLATDCDTKWELFFFSDDRTITSKVYNHGSKAWDDFLQLLKSVDDRDYVAKNSLWFSSWPQVAEQDLAGFETSDRDKKKAEAEEDEAMLEHFADRMANIYGERPTVPWWARANARIPDYYV